MEGWGGGGGPREWPGRHGHCVAVAGMPGMVEELGTELGPGFQAWLFYRPSLRERPRPLGSQPSRGLKVPTL